MIINNITIFFIVLSILFNPAYNIGTEPLDIVFIPMLSGLDDNVFNEMIWDSLNDNYGNAANISYVYGDDDPANIQAAIDDGADVIWSTYFEITDEVIEIFNNNPDVTFMILDYASDEIFDNVVGIQYDMVTASYYAGILASETTETGKIGFIGGFEIPPILDICDGFTAGLNDDTELMIEYIDSFTDEELAYETAMKMYEDGADIIFHAAGQAGFGMIKAAVETGNLAIGVDYDQSSLAPDNILTSVYKDLYTTVAIFTEMYLSGTELGGMIFFLNIETGLVGIV